MFSFVQSQFFGKFQEKHFEGEPGRTVETKNKQNCVRDSNRKKENIWIESFTRKLQLFYLYFFSSSLKLIYYSLLWIEIFHDKENAALKKNEMIKSCDFNAFSFFRSFPQFFFGECSGQFFHLLLPSSRQRFWAKLLSQFDSNNFRRTREENGLTSVSFQTSDRRAPAGFRIKTIL